MAGFNQQQQVISLQLRKLPISAARSAEAVCNQNTANATCHGNLCPCYVLLLPPCIPLLSSAAAAATAAARLAQRSVLAVASRPERWCQPRRAAPQKRVSFTLLFLRKSVVLTSTMSSKHSYARSGERGEKREDGQQGERKSGERREERDMGKGERANNWTEHGG